MGAATLDGDALTLWLQIREFEQVILPEAPWGVGGWVGRGTDSQPVLLLHAQNRTEARTQVRLCADVVCISEALGSAASTVVEKRVCPHLTVGSRRLFWPAFCLLLHS